MLLKIISTSICVFFGVVEDVETGCPGATPLRLDVLGPSVVTNEVHAGGRMRFLILVRHYNLRDCNFN